METRDESLDLIFPQESGPQSIPVQFSVPQESLQIVQERQKITWRHAIAQVNYLFKGERHDLVNYIPVSKSIPPPSIGDQCVLVINNVYW